MNFFVAKLCYFAGKHSSKQHGQGNFLEIFKKIITFQVMETTKIFSGFGQISSFLLKLLYLANRFHCSATCNKIPRFSTSKYSQIWFNPLVADCHFWCNI